MRVQKEREMESMPAAGDPVGGTPAWQSLSDGLLAGFCHELGGRASAFAFRSMAPAASSGIRISC